MSITAMKQAVATLKGRLDHPDASDTIASLLAAIAEEEACVPVLCVSSRSFARMRAGDDRINAWFPPATEAEDMPLYTTPQPAPKQEPDTSLIVEIEFDDGEKKAIPVSGTAQNMRYLKAWLDRLWRERAAPMQAQEQRKPLTDELIEDLRSDANRGFNIDKDDYFKAFRDAEAAHNIKEQP